MKKIIVLLIGLSCLILFFSLCNNKSDNAAIKKDKLTKQEFIKIVPKLKNGKPYYFCKMAKSYTEQARLAVIENGFDSMFIRLWYVFDFNLRVVELKKQTGIWSGQLHTLKEGDMAMYELINIDSIKSVKISPKSGWDFFINKIWALGIINLPDASEIPGYYNNNLSETAGFVVVEIATIAKYRVYKYNTPLLLPKIKETKNMEDIMIFIQDEFGIRRY